MNKIIIEDGKVLICTPITVSAKKVLTVNVPFNLTQYKSALKKALAIRINCCIEKLQAAVNNGAVYSIDEMIIDYIGGHFSFPAYKAMISSIEKLSTNDHITVKDFDYLELNQIIKAMPLIDFKDAELTSALVDELARKTIPGVVDL